jgi:hypothetical protein
MSQEGIPAEPVRAPLLAGGCLSERPLALPLPIEPKDGRGLIRPVP